MNIEDYDDMLLLFQIEHEEMEKERKKSEKERRIR